MIRFLRKKVVVIPLVTVAVLLVAGVGGIGWVYSSEIKSGALNLEDHEPDELDLEIAAIGQGRATLRATSDASSNGPWTKDGIWGLVWEGGYAQVGRILRLGEEEVIREFHPINEQEPSLGEKVSLDSFSFPENPTVAFGIPFQEVTVSNSLGEFPAWFVAGPRSTWAVFVHGRGANRREALRMLPTMVEMGFPSLVITYRNDEGLPVSDSGFYDFGETEWQEVEAAAQYALDHGAKDLVLVGYSMGGAIATNFLYQSRLAASVRAVVLDSPILSFASLVDFAGRRRNLPWPVTPVAKAIAGWRFDVNWGRRDYLTHTDKLEVPIGTSDRLAGLRPDLVTYVRIARATHVRAWNMGPDAYEEAVRGFLERVAPDAIVHSADAS